VGSWLSLSPDASTLAYQEYREARRVLRDLATGRERAVTLSGNSDLPQDVSHMVWSPDGSALMLTLSIDPCTGPITKSVDAQSTSIVRVDASTLAWTVLIEEDPRLFISLDWASTGVVTLQDKDGNPWQMDPQTGTTTRP
jgi:hypothetical protein